MDADSTQKPISVILDEIEEENALTRQGYPTLSACLDQHLQSKLALVKALRRAIGTLQDATECNPLCGQIAVNDITTILNQGRSVGDNKGSDHKP